MTDREIDLVYFDGCPHADRARKHLKTALGAGRDSWREWNLSDPETPDRFRRFASPTILVDGRDVVATGDAGVGEGMACRAAGPPPVAAIDNALRRHT